MRQKEVKIGRVVELEMVTTAGISSLVEGHAGIPTPPSQGTLSLSSLVDPLMFPPLLSF